MLDVEISSKSIPNCTSFGSPDFQHSLYICTMLLLYTLATAAVTLHTFTILCFEKKMTYQQFNPHQTIFRLVLERNA